MNIKMLKKWWLFLYAFVLAVLAGNAFAGEWYQIKNPHSLVADQIHLLEIRLLRMQGRTGELQELSRELKLLNILQELGPNDAVIVDHDYGDGTVYVRYLRDLGAVGHIGASSCLEKKDLGRRLSHQPGSMEATSIAATPEASFPGPERPVHSLEIASKGNVTTITTDVATEIIVREVSKIKLTITRKYRAPSAALLAADWKTGSGVRPSPAFSAATGGNKNIPHTVLGTTKAVVKPIDD